MQYPNVRLGWRRPLATAAAALLLWLPASPAHAQFPLVGPYAHPTVITASDGLLRFGGTVSSVDTDSVTIMGSNGLMRIPMRLARFEIGGVDTDPTRLVNGQSVLVTCGTLHGNVIGVHDGVARVAVDGDTIDLPIEVLNSTALSLPAPRPIAVVPRPIEAGSVTTTTVTTVQTPLTTTVTTGMSPAAVHVPYMVLAGTITDVQPDAIAVDMDGTTVHLPTAWPVHYRINNLAVDPRDLQVGSFVTMGIGPFDGAVRSVAKNVVVIDTTQGVPLALPIAVLPDEFTNTATVVVRDTNGTLSRVPLRAALQMQQDGTARIEAAPVRLAVPPPEIEPVR